MRWTLMAVVLGFLLDLLLGDPRWLYHPVRLIGKLISLLEKIIRSCLPKGKIGQRVGGVILVLLVVGISTAVPALILFFAYGFRWWLGLILEIFFCYQLFATKALKDASMEVFGELEKQDLESSRKAVSMIVGRDTQSLDAVGVTKAAVETVAENATDGVIAPLFFMMIGGASAGFFYKAVNTMDSMVGYKNDRYQYFGTCAAKVDDVLNFIPARLASIFMMLAAGLFKMDSKNAARIYKRDRFNHASPNSAQTEAVMAGALDIQLAGDASYFGKLHKKPTIGDPIRPVEIYDIPKANMLLYGTAGLAAAVFTIIRAMIQMVVFSL